MGKYSEEVAAPSNESCLDCVAGKYSEVLAANRSETCEDCTAGMRSLPLPQPSLLPSLFRVPPSPADASSHDHESL